MSLTADYERRTRAAVEDLRQRRAEHERRTGTALPDSRRIERWATEVGRRNDRRDSEGGSRRR